MLDDHARLSRVGVNVARITGPAKPQPKTSNHRTDPFLDPFPVARSRSAARATCRPCGLRRTFPVARSRSAARGTAPGVCRFGREDAVNMNTPDSLARTSLNGPIPDGRTET